MLIKGGRVLDALVTCRNVAFDKTGTLTTGVLACTGITSLDTACSPPAPGAALGAKDAVKGGSPRFGDLVRHADQVPL